MVQCCKLRYFVIKQWWLFPVNSPLQDQRASLGSSATAILWSLLRWEGYEVISSWVNSRHVSCLIETFLGLQSQACSLRADISLNCPKRGSLWIWQTNGIQGDTLPSVLMPGVRTLSGRCWLLLFWFCLPAFVCSGFHSPWPWAPPRWWFISARQS